MKVFKAITVVMICGRPIHFESGWMPTKECAKQESEFFAENALPAGLYEMGTRYEEKEMQI